MDTYLYIKPAAHINQINASFFGFIELLIPFVKENFMTLNICLYIFL